MIQNPFRPCDYCGTNAGGRSRNRNIRAWTLHHTTRKTSCPKCRPEGEAEEQQARKVLATYSCLLERRLVAEPNCPLQPPTDR